MKLVNRLEDLEHKCTQLGDFVATSGECSLLIARRIITGFRFETRLVERGHHAATQIPAVFTFQRKIPVVFTCVKR